MADITKCANMTCSIRKDCYRATAPESDWQSYSLFEYKIEVQPRGLPAKVTCDHFWSNHDTK